jgi:hypothetical protein
MRKTQSAELPRGAKNLNTCSSGSSSSLGVVLVIIIRTCQQIRKARQIHPTCRRRRRRVTSSTSSERQEHMSRRYLPIQTRIPSCLSVLVLFEEQQPSSSLLLLTNPSTIFVILYLIPGIYFLSLIDCSIFCKLMILHV